jgi:serine/threonine protein kinase
VAVKRIVVDTLSKEDREVKTQVRLDHDNVLKILTVEQNADFRYSHNFRHINQQSQPNIEYIIWVYSCRRYIVLELCTGTLADVCNNKYQGPDLPSDCTVLIEIATGLQYIHSKKLIHRDIKPENILISLDGRIKLSDFGLCKETSTNHTYLVSGPLKGTGIWMAQEMLNISVTDSTPIKGSIQSDIFSAGCVFFYFVTRGIHPFGEDNLIAGNIIKDTPVNFDSRYIAIFYYIV